MLDATVLIALTARDHVHHQQVRNGHRQVIDAYLVALAASKPNALLTTTDLHPDKGSSRGNSVGSRDLGDQMSAHQAFQS